MATKTKSKEEKDLEKKKKQREKELKILKAQNEMLEEAKQTVLSRSEWGDEDDPDGVIAEIEAAQQDNLNMAMSYHKANANEVNSMTYDSANKKGIEQYERRLKARNLTDEMLHRKELVSTNVSQSNVETKKQKRERRIRKPQIEQQMVEDNIRNNEISVKTVKNDKKDIFVSNPINKTSYNNTEWDLSSVPEYVQFDMIPLPSKGECYPIDSPLRSGVIPVSYLTASDENLIHSPNMYRDGKIIDVIISRKIVDKRIKATDLCKGDRDAVSVWLRATGYGDAFPIVVRNPNDTEKIYNTSINLSELKYKDFTLKGDENGLFEYKLKNGDILKFKQITKADDDEIKRTITSQFTSDTKYRIYNAISDVKYYFEQIELQDFEEKEDIKLDIQEIMDWSNDIENNLDELDNNLFLNAITDGMIMRTVSVNGNYSEEYIRGYIENMRSQEAYDYRTYMEENVAGVDFRINVNIPESDGGGSFETFLRIDDFIFRNV